MVRCHMYCAEQIIIPEILPDILKTYAKAVIRTQPYDLLRWSAAYFRCLALNVPPPVKPRLEKDSRFGYLTKGYLRVLLEQVGKGYYIRRDVIQKRWEGLCLPEEELFKFLSLCRMFNWTQIHWLKLFAVMVGSLNSNIKDTSIMICELLTDENEGGSSPVPIWMFQECYSFIAEMDCSKEQQFISGRKVLENGDLEVEKPIPEGPKILSSVTFREAVLEEWKKYVDDNDSSDGISNAIINESCLDITNSGRDTIDSLSSARASKVSSTFMIVGDYKNPQEVIRRSPDFDSIIVMLEEVDIETFNKGFNKEGPGFISEKTIDHAKQREAEFLEKREQMSQTYENQVEKYLQAESINLLKEIGPPWSWLHQFASLNCNDKSYNFVENESIASDETPSESGDESFDFEENKYKSPKETHLEVNDCSMIDVKELMDDNKILKDNINLSYVREKFEDGLDSGKMFVENNPSIIIYLDEVEKIASDTQIEKFDCRPLKEFLIKAEENGIVFKDLNDLFEYFKEECSKQTINIEQENKHKTNQDDSSKSKNSEDETFKVKTAVFKKSEKLSDVKKSETLEILSSEQESDSSEAEKAKTPMEEIFLESGIEVDNKILALETSENMILGLKNGKPEPKIKIKKVKEPKEKKPFWDIPKGSESTISISSGPTATIYSDISSKVYQDKESLSKSKKKRKGKLNESMEIIEPVEPFNCFISPMPGIGNTITQKTIRDFVTYLKYRSRDLKGMIYPRTFKEDQCPNMIDPVEE